jgi:hypothetical protein
MPQSDPRIDTRLKEFLDDKDNEKQNGYTLPNLFLQVQQVSSNQEETNNEIRLLKSRVDRHGRNIAQIKMHIDMQPDSALDSGLHNVEELKRELARKELEIKERQENSIWWQRSAIKWIIGGVAWIATTIAAALISSIMGHK